MLTKFFFKGCHPTQMDLLFIIFQYTQVIVKTKNKTNKNALTGFELETLGVASSDGDHYTMPLPLSFQSFLFLFAPVTIHSLLLRLLMKCLLCKNRQLIPSTKPTDVTFHVNSQEFKQKKTKIIFWYRFSSQIITEMQTDRQTHRHRKRTNHRSL